MRRGGSVIVAVVVLASACSGGGSATTPRAGHASTRGASSSAPVSVGSTPTVKEALPRIEQFVEHERGLRFKHQVTAKLLGNKAFVARLDKGDKKPKRKQIDKLLSLLASLGLVSPHADIASAFKSASEDSTLGFYDFRSKHLYVRGRRATPGVRAVLAHELTHALTDQWFGLHRPKLDRSNQELGLGFTALVEGDAERTRTAYEKDVLTPAQRATAKREEAGTGSTPHVPKVVLELIGFPYAIGPQFVTAVVAHGGIPALNAAYRRPPTSSAQLLNPDLYFSHQDPVHVATPPSDGPRLEHGDLGEVGLLLMLENGLSRASASSAVVGWTGDQFATWRTGSGWCLRDTVSLRNAVAAGLFDSILKAWIANRSGRSRIERSGQLTTFVTCSGSAPSE